MRAAPDASGLLDLIPDAVVVLEGEGRVAWVNAAAESLLGWRRDDVVGRECAALGIRDAEGRNVCDRAPLGRRMPVSKGAPERDFQVKRPDGSMVPVSMRCAYERDERFVVRRIVCTLRDARARRGMDMRTVEVISTVSHEIRSPLTSIKGFTKTMLDRWERFDDSMKREMLGAVNTDADRVTRLLGELLDISRLEAGRLRLRLTPVDLGLLSEKVVGVLGPRSETHSVKVEREDVPMVHGDADKLEQVLTNLVENALKYTEAGTVIVSVSQDDTSVVVAVSDEGEGIPNSHIGRLFRKFYRRERAGSPSGTGLGLYIAKGLIEAHGGTIEARSNPGHGSVFSFRIPINAEAQV